MDGLFIQQLITGDGEQRFQYFAWVLVVIVGTVLHELAHGWMAIRLGDPTPRVQGRMVGNPLVHMGPVSLVCLFFTGMAWGLMPIDPTRLRGKYAEAKVAFAGPAVNLGLAILAILAAGLWLRFGGFPEGEVALRGFHLLTIAAEAELVFFVFNMMPVPPLDGSHILANFSKGYAELLHKVYGSGAAIFLFLIAFMLAKFLWDPIADVVTVALEAVSGMGLVRE
ncbi:MAG: site-2 protease family protein [Planctomycetota bacterium]